MNKLNAENLTPQGDFIIVEKIDYDKEEKTDSGIIIKQSQILDSVFLQARMMYFWRIQNTQPNHMFHMLSIDVCPISQTQYYIRMK